MKSTCLSVAACLLVTFTPLGDAHALPTQRSHKVVRARQRDRNQKTDPVATEAARVLGLKAASLIQLELDARVGEPLSLAVPLGKRLGVLELSPFSVRSARHYRLLAQQPDGSFLEHKAGPVRTLRGIVRGSSGSSVAGALLDNGLHLAIQVPNEPTWWIEPLAGRVPGSLDSDYVMYREDDILPHGRSCANQARQHARPEDGVRVAAGSACGSGSCVAELGCDADVEYFNDYGSVAAVEDQINAVINAVNMQYESQVSITHQITTIIVRTAQPDPYTSTDPEGRLCEFITEWTNNHGSVPRDVAHLFTGAEIDASVIGIAADIGNSGICVNNGSCTGGPYGPLGSYCLSQSDFNGNFGCATDLTAHELGHLWGAFHCNCPSNTMNDTITCANSFSAGSISSITTYRDTRTCLSGGQPCTQDCQPGHALENEPLCGSDYDDSTNGGCNSSPAVWSAIALGDGVCGESGTFLADIPCVDDGPCTPLGETCDLGSGVCTGGPFTSRDTDWWQFTVAETREINWCVTAEFPVLVGIVDDGGGSNCGAAAFVSASTGFSCEEVCVAADLTPGTWTAFVAPNTFTGVDCGATYNGELSCDAAAGNPTTYAATVNQGIPDAAPDNPLVHTINVPDSFVIGDLDLELQITHTWVGDLTVDVEHGGVQVRIIDRPGLPDIDANFGCSSNDYDVVLDDGGMGGAIEDLCLGTNDTLPPSPPSYTPNNPLSDFDGLNAAGSWTITVTDMASPDPGTLVQWGLIIDAAGPDPCGGVDLCSGVDCSGLDGDCTLGVCNPADGQCQAQPANDGGPCEDGDLCTTADTCAAGACSSGPDVD